MSFLTNKHIVTAMLVAPVLAIVSYFAVDYVVKPDAIAAQAGQSFPLLAKSNCRYESGQCTLINGDFRVDLRPQKDLGQNAIEISLDSEFDIQGLRFALVDQAGNEVLSGHSQGNSFAIQDAQLGQAQNIQIAIRSSDVLYFVETQLSFLSKVI